MPFFLCSSGVSSVIVLPTIRDNEANIQPSATTRIRVQVNDKLAEFVGAMSRGRGVGFLGPLLSLTLLLVAGDEALAQSGGQVLYNGIVLPKVWPPVQGPTQAYQVPPYISNPPAVIPIDVGRQLFVDDFLIQSSTMARTQHQPVLYSGNPILHPLPSDTAGLAMPYSDGVWFDPGLNLFRMWYDCGGGNMICYAYSADGRSWTRPSLPNSIVPGTNQVLQIGGLRDSVTVWMDLSDPNPARKFKAFAYGPPANIQVYFSADGITWSPQQTQFSIGSISDRTTLFYNPFRNVWIDSLRYQLTLPASPNRASYRSRTRFYAESPDLLNWTPSNFTDSFWTGPDENDPPYVSGGTLPQLYNLDGVAYESLIVGLFSWFYPGPAFPNDDPLGLPGPSLVELGAGFSRDGFNWVRPTRGSASNALIPASNTPGAWNGYNTQSAGGCFLVVGDELWFYFSGRDAPHGLSSNGFTGLATLRRDGFYSMNAGATSASLTTRAVRFSGKYLFVNVKDPQGSLQVQLIDPNSQQVLATSSPIRVDETLHQVSWNGLIDLSAYANTPVQFQFNLTNGELYSFWVSSSASGASNGYVAAGGPGFTGPIDNVGLGSYSPAAATPLIAPNGGLFVNSVPVSLTSATPGAGILYTLDGTDPSSSPTASLYAAPFQLTRSTVVQAVAFAAGLTNSPVASASFTLAPADVTPPTISITSLSNGQTLAGVVVVSASASDNVAVANVQLQVDGVLIGTATSTNSTYAITFDTSALTNASHLFSVVATDTSGNQASASVTVSINNSSGDLSANLAGYWSFDPAYVNGNVLLDQSSFGTNGLAAGPSFVAGAIQQGMQFNGSSTFVQAGFTSSTQLDLTANLSLALWVKTTNSTRTEALLGKYAAAGSEFGYLLRTVPAGSVQLLLGGSNVAAGPRQLTDATKINDGKWHHLAVVIALGQSVTFYVDGLPSSTQSVNSRSALANSVFQMGLNPWSPFGTFFTGTMDEVRVYNRALLPAEVASLAGTSGNLPPLTVSITAPTNGQSVSGTIFLSATAVENVSNAAVTGVQFQVDGASIGTATSSNSRFTLNLNTLTVSNGSHQITVIANDASGNQASSSIQVTVNNAVALPVMTPAGGTFTNSVTVSLSTTPTAATIRYTLDGSNPATSGTAVAYGGPFQLTTSTTVTAVGMMTGLNDSPQATASFSIAASVPSQLGVLLIAPTSNQTVSGTVAVQANVSDTVSITGVQVQVDGTTVGVASTNSTSTPYSYTAHVNTTPLSNGAHQVTVIATDTTNHQAMASVSVVVSNQVSGGSGLVGYWSFDPGYVNGSNLMDQSGSGNTAVAAAPALVSGEIGQALQFNGVSSYASVAVGTPLDLQSDISLALWVKTTNSSRTEALVGKYSAAGSESGYLLRTTAAGVVELQLGGNNVAFGGRVATDGTKINDGNWHHVAVVIKLGVNVTFYVDGVASSTRAVGAAALANSSRFQMGLNPWSPYGTYFTGTMDEVRVYNRALSPLDVITLAQPTGSLPSDTTPPTVSITAPSDGQSVSQSIQIEANASDNVAVASVQFLVDGGSVGSTTTPPYAVNLDTTTLTNALHQISAIATDGAGNHTSSTAITVTVSNSTVSPPASPVAYWSFDPAFVSGSTLLDQSGNSNNATGFSIASVPGRVGQALQFNGSSSLVQVGSASQLDLQNSLTLVLWVKTSNSSRTEALLSKYSAAGIEYGYLLRTTPGGTVELLFGGGSIASGLRQVTDVTRINDGNWHHLAAVITLGTDVAFYVDGTLSSTKAVASRAVGVVGSNFQMGLNPWNPYGIYFTGLMDEVRVYNRALSASEIVALFQQ